jgi:hypothetical protein
LLGEQEVAGSIPVSPTFGVLMEDMVDEFLVYLQKTHDELPTREEAKEALVKVLARQHRVAQSDTLCPPTEVRPVRSAAGS